MTIQERYALLITAIKAAENEARLLQQELQQQGKEYQNFAKLFLAKDPAAGAQSAAQALDGIEHALQTNVQTELTKLAMLPDYTAVCKQRDRLRSSGVHLTALLKKAGAKGTEPISRKLLQSDAAAEIASYNQKVTRLSQSATNPNAFCQAFTLQKKAVPAEVDSGAGAAVVGPVKKGSIIQFGTYPQTAAGNDKTPIEWIVLDIIDGKALVISKYGLDAKPYNTQLTDITWQQCTLRKWLNGEFLQKAFTPEQQRSIAQTKVCNAQSECYSRWSTRGGNDTQDKIFLLSYREANKYFDVTRQSINNMKSRVIPTEYAKKQGAFTHSDYLAEGGKPAGWWWLRSPGDYQDGAAHVHTAGSLYYNYVSISSQAVRPAFLLNL